MVRPLFESLHKLREWRETRARAQWAECRDQERKRRAEREAAQRRLAEEQAHRAGYAAKIGQARGAMPTVDQLAERACLGRLDKEVAESTGKLNSADGALRQATQTTLSARGRLNVATAAKEKTQRCIDAADDALMRERVDGEEAEFDDDTDTFEALRRLRGRRQP